MGSRSSVGESNAHDWRSPAPVPRLPPTPYPDCPSPLVHRSPFSRRPITPPLPRSLLYSGTPTPTLKTTASATKAAMLVDRDLSTEFTAKKKVTSSNSVEMGPVSRWPLSSSKTTPMAKPVAPVAGTNASTSSITRASTTNGMADNSTDVAPKKKVTSSNTVEMGRVSRWPMALPQTTAPAKVVPPTITADAAASVAKTNLNKKKGQDKSGKTKKGKKKTETAKAKPLPNVRATGCNTVQPLDKSRRAGQPTRSHPYTHDRSQGSLSMDSCVRAPSTSRIATLSSDPDLGYARQGYLQDQQVQNNYNAQLNAYSQYPSMSDGYSDLVGPPQSNAPSWYSGHGGSTSQVGAYAYSHRSSQDGGYQGGYQQGYHPTNPSNRLPGWVPPPHWNFDRHFPSQHLHTGDERTAVVGPVPFVRPPNWTIGGYQEGQGGRESGLRRRPWGNH
ncbi:uncharacterized protein EHS24_008167 [Apiotrichum porosum]|uniref:Uncharacterized protein n=1 Tax=Apiotrichum porosum TaxID=105984 RepID=A0A427XT22_9TREE|nr:uncharacterized protein EHS24_008167 [Apiotrichum porosum]RSH81967.1 hypothetical protein EHS24_008167 [Apiotrichum porosum]